MIQEKIRDIPWKRKKVRRRGPWDDEVNFTVGFIDKVEV